MNRPTKRDHIFALVIIALGLLLDQAAKLLAVKYLRPIGTYVIFEGVFQLSYRENTGASFSILSGRTWFLAVFTCVVIVALGWIVFAGKVRRGTAYYSLAAIMCGGAGNLIDRVCRGYVVDMFDFCLIDFAVFNVADIFVTCGAVVFIIYYIVKKGEVFIWRSSQAKQTRD